MGLNKKEKQVLIGGVVLTMVLTLGFTMSQGSTIFSKDDNYKGVTEEKATKISKEDYEVISEATDEGTTALNIYTEKKFSEEEIVQMIDLLEEDYVDIKTSFELYLFTEEAKAKDFNLEYKSTYTIERVVSSGEDKSIKISDYHVVSEEVESIPKDYEVLSLKEDGEYTDIKIYIEKIESSEDALAKIKFMGQMIKDSNSNINLLNIEAYTNENKSESWQYNSSDKQLVINNKYSKLN